MNVSRRLMAGIMLQELIQSIVDGWETGTIEKAKARERSEVRYATLCDTWAQATGIVAGCRAETVLRIAKKAAQVKPPVIGNTSRKNWVAECAGEALILLEAETG